MVQKSRSWLLVLTLVLTPALSRAQTSLALSAYGAFTPTTNGALYDQSPSNSAGALLELRHISGPIFGFEAAYSYNRADQTYSLGSAFTCGLPCPPLPPVIIPVNAHEITGDWIPSLHIGRLRPFGVVGAGVLFDVPGTSASGTQTSTQAVYVYGAGLDARLLPHFGLRFQYRGNFYKLPNVNVNFTTTATTFTHTAEPMIGAYFNF
jgi:opacity protein-like surface antigen